MIKFNKLLTSKIVSVIISIVFLCNTSLYACPASEDTFLRVPLGETDERMEKAIEILGSREAYDEVRDKIEKAHEAETMSEKVSILKSATDPDGNTLIDRDKRRQLIENWVVGKKVAVSTEDEERYRSIVEEAGAIYIGIQDLRIYVLVLFDDPETGSTLGVKIDEMSLDNVVEELQESRRKFSGERKRLHHEAKTGDIYALEDVLSLESSDLLDFREFPTLIDPDDFLVSSIRISICKEMIRLGIPIGRAIEIAAGVMRSQFDEECEMMAAADLIEDESPYAIGGKVGGTSFKFSSVERDGGMDYRGTKKEWKQETGREAKDLSLDEVANLLTEGIIEVADNSPDIKSQGVIKAGISLPGQTENSAGWGRISGYGRTSPNIPCFYDQPLAELIEAKLRERGYNNIQVFLINDSYARLLGELSTRGTLGQNGWSSGMSVISGTGVNASMAIDGEPFTDDGALAELGNVVVAEKPFDPLEGKFTDNAYEWKGKYPDDVALNEQGLQRFEVLINGAGLSNLANMLGFSIPGHPSELPDAVEAAKSGDKKASRLIEIYGLVVGRGLASIVAERRGYEQPWADHIVLVSGVFENFAKGVEVPTQRIEVEAKTPALLVKLKALRDKLPDSPRIISEFELLLEDIGQENQLELSGHLWSGEMPHENELREPWGNLTSALSQDDEEAVFDALSLFRERLQVRAAYMRLREGAEDSGEERLVIQVRDKGSQQTLLDKIQQDELRVRLVFRPTSTNEEEYIWDVSLSQVSLYAPDPANPQIVNIIANMRLDEIFGNIYDIYKYIAVAQLSFNNGQDWYSSAPDSRADEVQEQGVVVIVPQETRDPEFEEILGSLRMYSPVESAAIAHEVVRSLEDKGHLVDARGDVREHLEASLSLGLGMVQKTGAIVASTDGTPRFPYWYSWLRDSWKALHFYIRLYELTESEALHGIIQRYMRFILNSDTMVDPSVQRINILGYALYDSDGNPEGFAQTRHAPRWGEDSNWGDQHDGPAHALRAVLDYLRLPQVIDDVLRRDIHALIDVNVRHLVDVVLSELPSDDLWEEITARHHIYTVLLQFDVLSDVLEQNLITDEGLLGDTERAVANLRVLFNETNENGFIQQKEQGRKRLAAHLGLVGKAVVKLERTKPQNLDASAIGAVCHIGNRQRALELIGHGALLNTFMALDERFEREYPINRSGQLSSETILWGRYGDDIYNGDPYSRFIFTEAGGWVLISLWRIQTLVSLAEDLAQGRLEASDETLQVFLAKLNIQQVDGKMSAQEIAYSLKNIAQANLHDLIALAPGPGQFAEQIDRYNGVPRGVQPLGWSQWEYIKTVLQLNQLKLSREGSVRAQFRERFGVEPSVISKAPGRANIIGEHVDYPPFEVYINQAGETKVPHNFSLPFSLQQDIIVVARARDDNKMIAYSEDYGTKIEIDLDEIDLGSLDLADKDKKAGDLSWTNYLLGMYKAAKENGMDFRGAEFVIQGNVPLSAGTSSSAALCVSLAFSFSGMFGWGLNDTDAGKVELALLARQAEHNTGSKCGYLDQLASIFGAKDSAISIDYGQVAVILDKRERGETVTGEDVDKLIRRVSLAPLLDKGYKFLLVNSNVVRPEGGLAGTDYNKRVEELEAAGEILARLLGTPWAPHVSCYELEDLIGVRDEFIKEENGEVLYKRAYHALSEKKRVLDLIEALESGDINRVAAAINECGRSLSMEGDFEISALIDRDPAGGNFGEVIDDTLDRLVDIALERGAIAARMMGGGGGGGCAILLLAKNLDGAEWREALIEEVKVRSKTGREVSFIGSESKPSEGARVTASSKRRNQEGHEVYTFSDGKGTFEVVPSIGGIVTSWTADVDGREIEMLRTAPSLQALKDGKFAYGIPVLAFFSNRIRGKGKEAGFEFRGQQYPIPVRWDNEENAIHGEVYDKPFTVERQGYLEEYGGVGMVCSFDAKDFYGEISEPWEGNKITMTYVMIDGKLSIFSDYGNYGDEASVTSHAIHPYWTTDNREDLIVVLGAEKVFEAEACLPSGELLDIEETPFAGFKEGGLLGDVFVDDVFTGFEVQDDGSIVSIYIDLNRDTELRVITKGFPHKVVYAPVGEDFFCDEPSTSGTDSFNHMDEAEIFTPVIHEPGEGFHGVTHVEVNSLSLYRKNHRVDSRDRIVCVRARDIIDSEGRFMTWLKQQPENYAVVVIAQSKAEYDNVIKFKNVAWIKMITDARALTEIFDSFGKGSFSAFNLGSLDAEKYREIIELIKEGV